MLRFIISETAWRTVLRILPAKFGSIWTGCGHMLMKMRSEVRLAILVGWYFSRVGISNGKI